MVTHVHYCRHCDSTCNCRIDNCLFEHDISYFHDCGEKVKARKLFKHINADFESCQYGCNTLPCVHNKWPSKKKEKTKRFGSTPTMKRPEIVNFNNKKLMICNENSHTISNQKPYIATTTDIDTTSYVSDGNNFDDAMAIQKKWIKAKVERLADSFPKHLQSLVKEMRGIK
jgi:hypothetical protein